MGEDNYDLILQNDTNTKGYNQWFYFSFEFGSVREVSFNIVNFIKKKSLFSLGVKPCFYVMEEEAGGKEWGEGGKGEQGRWRQVVSDVRYYKNGILR